MAKFTTREFIAAFKELALAEFNEFVKTFEEEFDVTAVTPAATVAATPAADGEAAAIEEEKDSFDIVLEATGDKKVAVIKEVRALTSLSLKEAKDLADLAPKAILKDVDKEIANRAKEQLEGVGASATVR